MTIFRRSIRDERGIALPLSLMVLVLLVSITMAFVAMSATEPLISGNLKSGDQAFSLAEAGVEHALWALTNAAAPGSGLTDPLPNPIPAPYNGGTLVALGNGAYSLRICTPDPAACPPASADPSDRNVTATGYVVRNGVAVPATPALLAQTDRAGQRMVQVTLAFIGPLNTPGALTVAGSVQLQGNTTIDGNDSAAGAPNSCPNKAGVTIRDKSTLPDGTVVNNSISTGGSSEMTGTPASQSVNTATFQKYLFTAAELAALRDLARSKSGTPGYTYVKPANNSQFVLSPSDGLTFVDTVDGLPVSNPPTASQLASIKITGASNNGWLIVMGSIRIDGNVTYNGLIYAVNDISYKGVGSGGIFGAMVSQNVIDAVSTVVDSDTSGNSKIYYDCGKAANGGGAFTPPTGYFVKSGTWQEVSN